MDIIGIILIGVLVGIAIGIIFICIYFCNNRSTPSHGTLKRKSELKQNFPDIESGSLNQDPETQDILSSTVEKEGLHSDKKKIKLVGRNPNDIFYLEKLYDIVTPDSLFEKHVVNGGITPIRAIELSKRRGEKFAMEHKRNTVFENPQKFYCCDLQNETKDKLQADELEKLGAKHNRPCIASIKVRTYQCYYDVTTKIWKAKDLGQNILLLKSTQITQMKHIIFFIKF